MLVLPGWQVLLWVLAGVYKNVRRTEGRKNLRIACLAVGHTLIKGILKLYLGTGEKGRNKSILWGRWNKVIAEPGKDYS